MEFLLEMLLEKNIDFFKCFITAVRLSISASLTDSHGCVILSFTWHQVNRTYLQCPFALNEPKCSHIVMYL